MKKRIETGTEIRVVFYDFKHDSYGNPCAHFEVWMGGEIVKKTGRRDQIGYSNTEHEGATYWIHKNLLEPDQKLELAQPITTNRSTTNTREYKVS